ncbi:MAG: DUF1499 domain-containing protein [Bacteroidota bacterium]
MSDNKISKWVWGSVGFSITGAVLLVLSGYGYQWGWWELSTALIWLLPGSSILALIGFALAMVFGALRRNNPNVKGVVPAAIGLVLSIAVISVIGYWFAESQQYPPIHDITTDIENPPEFKAIVPLRADAANDTTYGDQDKADIQRETYPDIETLYLDVGYDQAFDRALDAAKQMPWEEIVTQDKQAGLIEAYDKLPWFGFIDDVVIRVDSAETDDRSKIDVRSVSRIGKGDIGVNAHRIHDYLEAVKNQ